MQNNLKAISWMLIHVLTAVIINVNYRLLAQTFEKIYIISFYNVFAFLCFIPFAIFFRKHVFKSKLLCVHMARAACYVIAQFLLIYTFNNIKFIEVISITLTYPLISVFAATIILKEKIDFGRIIALSVGAIGAIIIIDPVYTNINIYSLFAVIAVILWVTFDILVKRFNSEYYFIQFFYLIIFMAIFSIIPAFFVTEPFPRIFSLWIFIPIGFLVILYMFSVLMSVINTESLGITVPFYFMNLILASFIGWFLFDEVVSIKIFVGSSIILSATLYIVYKEYRVSKYKK